MDSSERSPVISSSPVLSESEFTCRVNQNYKRVFDLLFSFIFILFCLPLFIMLAIVIKVNSPGPLLYCQERVTQGEQPFKMFKFRSMPHNIELHSGPVWGSGEDLRTDRVGRFLRITRADELPQLFNILLGDMSFIGPRPERTYFVEQFKAAAIPGYLYRHSVRTGLTGYAQVINPYIGIDQIAQKTELDLYYIQHWSPGLDLWILGKALTYVFPYANSAFKIIFEPLRYKKQK